MLTDLSFPFIPAWNQGLNTHWREHSRILFDHPAISHDQKRLWQWLASTSQSANEFKIHCSHSYEQISIAMNHPCLVIHRLLFGMKLMGFLRARLPVTFDLLTSDMTLEIRKIELCMPSKVFLTGADALTEMNQGVRLITDQQKYTELTLV